RTPSATEGPRCTSSTSTRTRRARGWWPRRSGPTSARTWPRPPPTPPRRPRTGRPAEDPAAGRRRGRSGAVQLLEDLLGHRDVHLVEGVATRVTHLLDHAAAGGVLDGADPGDERVLGGVGGLVAHGGEALEHLVLGDRGGSGLGDDAQRVLGDLGALGDGLRRRQRPGRLRLDGLEPLAHLLDDLRVVLALEEIGRAHV